MAQYFSLITELVHAARPVAIVFLELIFANDFVSMEIGLEFRVVHRSAKLMLITPQARLLWLINAMFPSVVCKDFEHGLPRTARTRCAKGDKLKRGWKSQYLVAPSLPTRPADRAASDHKEEAQPVANSSSG